MKRLRIENNMIIVALLIVATLATAAALYLEAENYSKDYIEVLITLDNFQEVIDYAANSLTLKLAKLYTLGCVLWLALAATIFLQAVI